MIDALAAALRGPSVEETLLLVPSHRVGRQWLDEVARRTGGIAAVRTVTLKRLVLDYAEPELRARGLRQPTRPERLHTVATALERIARDPGEHSYFTSLTPSLSLVEALARTWDDLDAAAARSTPAALNKVCGPHKGGELAALFRHCRSTASRKRWATPDAIHQAALARIAACASLPRLLVPALCVESCSSLEERFLHAWPEHRRVHLEEGGGPVRARMQFARADSPINEARDVFRWLLEEEIPFDQAEIVCLDPAAAVPALCRAGLELFGGAPEELPITFAPGLPGFHAGPCRLLAAWLEWLDNGIPAEGLARMLDSGLVDQGWRTVAPGISAELLASRLRALPIRGTVAGYRNLLGGRALATPLNRAEQWLAAWVASVVPMQDDDVDVTDPRRVLAAAETLLARPIGRDGKLAAYARAALLDAIRTWQPFCAWSGFDPMAWLGALVRDHRVMGMGAQPGMLHVADLASGGHSGRRFLAVVGMDDGRFPGQPRQDPVLLDRERSGLSPHLRQASHWRKQRERAFARLLARAEGTVRLSYASHADGGGREQYPAVEYIRLRDAHDESTSPEATLVPTGGAASLGPCEDWLRLLLPARPGLMACEDFRPWFPHFASGAAALAARESARFTEYDGFVPEAGDAWRDAVFSPTHLEELAACPLQFFMKRVLGIKPPERADVRPGRWLAGNARGTLLHDLFQDFLDDLDRRGLRVDGETWAEVEERLAVMLDAAMARYRRECPPDDDLAYRREVDELREAAAIFLRGEQERQQHGRPLYREVALGGAKDVRTPWDRETPIRLTLPSGTDLLLQGRVDRIDRLDGGGLAIIDYKTGKSTDFSRTDPFQQGRHLQPLLYTRMLEQTRNDAGVPEPVHSFAYFFPMPRDEGLVLAYPRLLLGDAGLAIVDALVRLVRDGVFPFTTDAADVRFSDYLPLYGDPALLAASARDKASADPALAGWRELRGLA